MRSVRIRAGLRRLAPYGAALALLGGIIAALNVATAAPAHAATVMDNLGYPYYNQPCEHSPYTTTGAAYYCSNYDWGPTRDTTHGWTESDAYDPAYGNYAYRNCTDYVAWQLASYGVPSADYAGLGNGGDWYTNAGTKSLSRGITPKVGAAAVVPATYDKNGHETNPGHVAYVRSIAYNSDGSVSTITVWEYNHDAAGDGDIWTGPPSSRGFTQYVYFAGYMTKPPDYITGGSSSSTSFNLADNGGFNNGTPHWSPSGSANFAVYEGDGAYEGDGYGATNASASGDSIRNNVGLTIATGDTFCGNAEVTTAGSGSGGAGQFTLWLTGGAPGTDESSSVSFSSLPGSGQWTPVQTCVTATSSHASLRIQFYPTVGGPTIGIDAVDVHKTLSQNGGFNNGTSPWSASGSANFAVHTSSSSYEGSGYAATNASVSGDSIRENKTISIASGDTYCGSAEVSTAGTGSGGSGQFVIWLLGGSSSESSTMSFSSLPGSGQWTPVQTCVTATTAHTSLRIQFYPTVGGPTINVDAVDVHSSFAQNGGFNNGTSPWSASGSANFAVSSGGYEGTKYAATNASAAGDSLRENKSLTIGSGDTFCGSAEVSTAGSGSGGGGHLVLWLTGGPGSDENSSVTFSSLPGSGQWTWVHTCVTATSSHATLRVQVYPTVGGPTINVDAVDVH